MEGYREDLAHTHDQGYGAFSETAARAILPWVRPHAGTVVDLGCGGGHAARVFADAGFGVLGIDQSPALLGRARARVPEGRFEAGSFLDAELPPGCAAVVAIGEVLTYTFDARNGREALAGLYRRIHDALRPRGLLAFDLLGPTGDTEARRTWTAGPGWAVMAERRESGHALTREIVTFREHDGAWRRDEETHHVVLFEPDAVLADLRAAGFAARRRRSYSGPRAAPGHSVYVARRPG